MNKGFAPVINKKTKVLILGSFPGVKSLEKKEYYGHPQNSFWKIISDIIGENLKDKPYDKKLNLLLKSRIGLWDTIEKCKRNGSLDSNIKEEKGSNFAFLKNYNIKLICFNGKKAGSYEKNLIKLGYKTIILPSTSPAHASIPYEEKLKSWKKSIMDGIGN